MNRTQFFAVMGQAYSNEHRWGARPGRRDDETAAIRLAAISGGTTAGAARRATATLFPAAGDAVAGATTDRPVMAGTAAGRAAVARATRFTAVSLRNGSTWRYGARRIPAAAAALALVGRGRRRRGGRGAGDHAGGATPERFTPHSEPGNVVYPAARNGPSGTAHFSLTERLTNGAGTGYRGAAWCARVS